jgi:hydroxymethylpyrimidine pyrophosphatase-like HAD family hydrolase
VSTTPLKPHTFARPSMLVACDIDGTLLEHGEKIPAETVATLDLVRAAGHKVVLATGRSLVGLLPIATRLGLTEGFAVCSNGAVTIRLDRGAASGYAIQDAQRFDTSAVIGRALALEPGAYVGVEEVGWGWRVNALFARESLNGEQKQVQVADLCAAPATRVALHGPGIAQHAKALAESGVTVTPAGPDWLDVTAPRTNKATTLERLRVHMGIRRESTVAVGDGANDIDMLVWADRGVAMGHAPEAVRAAAGETTGTISQHGAVAVLRSLLPHDVETTALSPLAGQLAMAVRTASEPVVLRVWHENRSEVARCDVWVRRGGGWVRHGPIPSGAGATMRAIEVAVREAGLAYPRGLVGRRRAHWRSTRDQRGQAGFELPLHDRLPAPVLSVTPEPSMS